MNKLDFYASEIHYFDHIIPIWNMLPNKYKGIFNVSLEVFDKRRLSYNEFKLGKPTDNLTLVASYKDYCMTKGKVIFMEHGIGHNYGNGHPAYVGGRDKDRVVLFLNQHALSQNTNLKAYPNTPSEIIGTPKTDSIKPMPTHNDKPIVCISFHWDCFVCNNTRSAYYYYKDILSELAQSKEFTLIAHGHPRRNDSEMELLGIKFYSDLAEIMKIADIYVNDNSSSMYEFALTGKPVIVLNCPLYDRNRDTGIRFWQYILGKQVNSPNELKPTILSVIRNDTFKYKREEILHTLYPFRYVSTDRAVEVILEYLYA
jgi:hypothetical protein